MENLSRPIDPIELPLAESQIASLILDGEVGTLKLNYEILRQFKLTNRLACKILCSLCQVVPPNSATSDSDQEDGPAAAAATSAAAAAAAAATSSLNNGRQEKQQQPQQQQQQQGSQQPLSENGSPNTVTNQSVNSVVDTKSGKATANNLDISLFRSREDSIECREEIDYFAEYCRKSSMSLKQLLQTFDDADFVSDKLFRYTNFVLHPQKHSTVPPLIAFKRFWQFCSNLASSDKNGLSIIGRVFFSSPWLHNQEFQLHFIANCIEQNLIPQILFQTPQQQAQQQPNLSQIVPNSELLKCQPDFEGLPELNNWKFQRLYQILIDFTTPDNVALLRMNNNCFTRVVELFAWPLQYCPDLTVLGLLSVSDTASAAKVEILKLAIPTFLNASHPNAAIILHSIWSSDSHSQDPPGALTQQKPNTPLTWSQKTLLLALSDHYIQSPPEEQQQRLSRILDVAQDIKTLFRLLDGNCYPFVIDLACLASRREYLKLDKWLMDKFTENGENFIRALNSFLTKRYLPILSATNKDSNLGPVTLGGPALPAETLAVLLAFLQQCLLTPPVPGRSPFIELSQAAKKEVYALVGSSALLLQRAPRHPPPGVATNFSNEYPRSGVSADRLVHLPMDGSDVDKLQTDLEAKRMAQRNSRPNTQPTLVSSAPAARPSIANNANIDNLLPSSENISIPPELVQDKVFFIVNNLSLVNLKQKAEEFKELFGNDETYYDWIAQYFSIKRAALEQNFQPLYANFLYELKNQKLIEAMTRETYKNIKHLLRTDKKADNIGERTLLKNLGQWLGLLTLARNKPILHVDLDLKGLLVEAYHKGTQELLYVVPFLAEVLKTTQKSKIFKPNNPFVLGLLRALVELRQQPNLKLNLEFQVEVLFNYLGVDLNKLVGQSNILNGENYFSKIESQLGSKNSGLPQQQPLAQQNDKNQLSQSTSQGGPGMGNLVMRPNEFVASLSPLNTPPLMGLGPNSSALPNAGLQSSVNNTLVSWSGKFKYSDLDVTNTASLNNSITIQPGLAVSHPQPNMKSVVRPALEMAISEWLPTILEKSLKMCLPTVEQIIKKDFALDPDENHMQRAAHCLVRHLVSYMAMIPCRDPEQVEQSLKSNLKAALMRAYPTLRKDQCEQAVMMITSENLELARAFIIKTAVERAQADIDKLLQSDYELRRSARLEGHQYFDPEHLAFHTKLVSDGIRLKPAPIVPEQMRNYEEIGQNVAGFKRIDLPYSEPNVGSSSPFNEHGTGLNLPPIVPTSVTSHLGKASPMNVSNLGTNVVNQLMSNRVTPNQFQSVPLFVNLNEASKATTPHLPAADNDSSISFIDSLFNEIMPQLRQVAQTLPANMTAEIVSIVQYMQTLRQDPVERNYKILIQLALELQTRIEALQNTNRNQANYLVQPIISTNNTFPNASPQVQSTPANTNALLQQRETSEGDPPGLLEKTDRLLREWVNVYQTGQSVKMFPMFVQQMTAHGILKTDDLVTRFFRLSTEVCVESCYRLLSSHPNGFNSIELRNKCYETLDAFTTLIVLLIKNSGSSSSTSMTPEPTAKINLLSKILSIIANVAIKDQETRLSEFQHLAYYRILILLFIELNLSPPMLGLPAQGFGNFNQISANVDALAESVQYSVLNEFTKTLRTLRPTRVPSFAFAWLDFLSHRLFIEKCLVGNPAIRPPGTLYKGWGLYAQLLIDLIKFEAPFLRNVELPTSVDLLYKGTLKIFLVLLHDFPEFLCEYCYSLCDVIPCNAIQLRNLVLSAFPRKMRLPDPFTPNLKIDELAEMHQAPKTVALQSSLINTVPFKEELDSFLRNRTPMTFLNNLESYLRVQNQYLLGMGGSSAMNSLNVPLLNALVLYVGQYGITAIPTRPIRMTTLAGTTHIDVLQHLAMNLDTEGRYLFLNAIANQLRYPNSHTHYFSSALLYLFIVAPNEQIQEQITRVLVERLIIMRPHPWGLLVTFIELIKNPLFKFWQHKFVRCAPEIEKLFESVARSCCVQNTTTSQKGK